MGLRGRLVGLTRTDVCYLQHPRLLSILCKFNIKYIKIRSRISMVNVCFHKISFTVIL